MPKYSIVVPFHNEEENVTTLYDRVKLVMEQVGDSFEMVFVDDGSRDRTYRLLEEIAAVDSRVLVIKLRRNSGVSHYGLSRTVRVCFDLLTIRFLLRYMTRPLHFFGLIGVLGMMAGGGFATWLLCLKVFTGQHVMQQHGPIFVIAGVLILAGIQMLGIGLLGELQVRHFHTPTHRAPYAVDRILRLRSSEESLLQ